MVGYSGGMRVGGGGIGEVRVRVRARVRVRVWLTGGVRREGDNCITYL